MAQIGPFPITSGQCFDDGPYRQLTCCPKWLVDCCAYRNCGLPTRLIASTSDGTYAITGSGGTWAGSLTMITGGVNAIAPIVAFVLTCDAGVWKCSIFVGLNSPEPVYSATETALAADCESLNLTFLFSDIDFPYGGIELPDLVISFIQDDTGLCENCCCVPNGVSLVGPIEMSYGDCEFCPEVLEGGAMDILEGFDYQNCGSWLVQTDDRPDLGGPVTFAWNLRFEVDNNRCKAVMFGHAAACPGASPQYSFAGRWEGFISRELCRDGGEVELTLIEESGVCTLPEKISIMV